MLAVSLLCVQMMVGSLNMPTGDNPEGFRTTVTSFRAIYNQIQEVLRHGLAQYRRAYRTDDPSQFTREDKECTEAQIWLGYTLDVVSGIGKTTLPEHAAIYKDNLERAKRLVDDKCRNGRGGGGQRLFVQWTVDLTEANRGTYTRPTPNTVRLVPIGTAPASMFHMQDERAVEVGNPGLGLNSNLTPELLARLRSRDAILGATAASVGASLPPPVTGPANAPAPVIPRPVAPLQPAY
jgi:hypothetical protein